MKDNKWIWKMISMIGFFWTSDFFSNRDIRHRWYHGLRHVVSKALNETKFFDFIYMDAIRKLLSTQHIYGYNLYLDASRKWNRQPKICSLLASTNCVWHFQNSNPVIELILYLDAFRILKVHFFRVKELYLEQRV